MSAAGNPGDSSDSSNARKPRDTGSPGNPSNPSNRSKRSIPGKSDEPVNPRSVGDFAGASAPEDSTLVAAISALAARPGARLGMAGLMLGAGVAAFGTGTARFEAGIEADLRVMHGLERLDRLVDEAGAQLMRARVAPRRETDAGTRGAFHRLTALSFQAEQTRGDLIAGVRGGEPRAEMADMLSADRRLWDLLADESGLVREGSVAMATRLHGDSQRQALDAALAERKSVRETYATRMREASRDAAGSSRAWAAGGLAAIALLVAAGVRGMRPRRTAPKDPLDASDASDASLGAASRARPDTTDLTLAQAAARRLEDATAATLAGLEARMARLAWLELQSAGHIARLGTPGPRPQALDRAGARASLRAFDIGLRDAIAQVETLIHMSNALDDLVVQRGSAVRKDAAAVAAGTASTADMTTESAAIAQEWNRLLALASAGAAAASRVAHQTLDRLEISAALLGRWIGLVDEAIALAEQSGLAPVPVEAGSLKPADAATLWQALGRVRARLKRAAA